MLSKASTNPGFRFLLQIDGVTRAAFHECSGLDAGRNAILLRRGITSDAHLSDWFKQEPDAKSDRRNVSIVLLNETGAEKARWSFRRGWLAKYEGPEFNAKGNDVEIEVIELAHEGLETEATQRDDDGCP